MGSRLTRIITRTGDDGTTGLGNRERVRKDHPRIEALGSVDELNAVLGLALCEPMSEALRALLIMLQHALFDLGSELACPGKALFSDEQLERLEREAAQYNAQLPPLKEFILPGGTRLAALLHLARTVCRRAERAVVRLSQSEPEAVRPLLLSYLNRLSDLLFILARCANQQAGGSEIFWQRHTPNSA